MKYWRMLQCGWTLKTWWGAQEVRHKRPRTVWSHLCEMSRIDKSVETESRWCWPGAGGRGCGEWLLIGTGFLLGGWWRHSGTREMWWLYDFVNVLKATELYTFKGWILWHENHILINQKISSQAFRWSRKLGCPRLLPATWTTCLGTTAMCIRPSLPIL